MWKVVAADDEAYMRDVLENLIDWKKCGCELVSVVSDGAKMIEAIKKLSFTKRLKKAKSGVCCKCA